MPNNTEQTLRITGPEEVIEEIACSHFDEDDCLHFQSIVPMPMSLHITSGGHVSIFAAFIYKHGDIADILERDYGKLPECKATLLLDSDPRIIAYLDQYNTQEKMTKAINEGRMFISNAAKYGFTDWYGWSNRNWGTKWSAYDGETHREEGELTASFETAWSPPIPVIEELARLYPEVDIRHAYIDEGYGFGGVTYYAEGVPVEVADVDNVAEFGREEFGHVPYEEEEEDD